MLTASEINFILGALHEAMKAKIPNLKEGSVSSVEATHSPGTFASLALSVLLLGEVDAKLTLVFEWETAIRLANKILNLGKVDSFGEDSQLALEEVIKAAGEKIAACYQAQNRKVEALLLPSLVETNVLLSFHPAADILKVNIQTAWDPIVLYVAVPKEVEAQNAA